jgi:hypothetical protein
VADALLRQCVSQSAFNRQVPTPMSDAVLCGPHSFRLPENRFHSVRFRLTRRKPLLRLPRVLKVALIDLKNYSQQLWLSLLITVLITLHVLDWIDFYLSGA